MNDEWFGWRVVNPTGCVGHAFRAAAGRSLRGRVAFGPRIEACGERYRACRRCSHIWSARYPRREQAGQP